MSRFLFAFGVFAIAGLTISTVTLAMDDDPPPAVQPGRAKAAQAQPKAVQIQPAQPGGGTVTRVTAARMATLEEEFETLEAHRDVKKAIVKAAEVAVKGAEASMDLIGRANAPQAEVVKAKIEVEAARAQLDIRMAELKEVEVKIKFAKKRLEEAKAAGVRGPGDNPFRKLDLKQVDPPPPPADGQKLSLGLKKRILELEAVADDNKAAVAKAATNVRKAKAELDAHLEHFDPKFANHPVIEQAREKVEKAKAAFDKAAMEHITRADDLAKLRAKLSEMEKSVSR